MTHRRLGKPVVIDAGEFPRLKIGVWVSYWSLIGYDAVLSFHIYWHPLPSTIYPLKHSAHGQCPMAKKFCIVIVIGTVRQWITPIAQSDILLHKTWQYSGWKFAMKLKIPNRNYSARLFTYGTMLYLAYAWSMKFNRKCRPRQTKRGGWW